jgi:enoyl-CoA hydratase
VPDITHPELILKEERDAVALIRLNRPQVLNALNLQLMDELVAALEAYDADDAVRVVVITGDEKAFAAGADISEMAGVSSAEMRERNQFEKWERIKKIRKPLIAAVSGAALGGGCELAMLCDIIVASETAKFGQPEINLGLMPGAGGTQRLVRAVGKSLAMEVVLNGRFLSAQEALAAGLVSRVVPVELYLVEALKLAGQLAQRAPLALQLAKESVLRAFEMALSDGLELERASFYSLFDTADAQEGTEAFLNKRKPEFKGR